MNQIPNDKKIYDLEERTAVFAENIIDLMKKIPKDLINQRLIPQVVGSGGSLGANYCEANEAKSKKDFQHKIGICKKRNQGNKTLVEIISQSKPRI